MNIHVSSHLSMNMQSARTQTFLVILVIALTMCVAQYQPTWESIDSRPLPDWYDKAKVGVFVHWSLNSVPSFAPPGRTSCDFWLRWMEGDTDIQNFTTSNYPPGWTFQDFGSEFKAEFFYPDAFARFFQDIGARYVVFVSKHAEGWTNWKSRYQWGFNSVDEGPRRDIVGELSRSVRNLTNLHFGLYSNLNSIFHPLFLEDYERNFTSNKFPTQVAMPMLKELVTRYEPEIIWSDGVVAPVTDKYWTSLEFLTWLYNESPVKDYVVTNDRWGYGVQCKHGGFLTCKDRYNPKVLQARKWESCVTIDQNSWCYNRNSPYVQYLHPKEIISTLVQVVSCGGNFLLNFGPTQDGRILPIFQERLRSMGYWLRINGEAIYESRPWRSQNDSLNGNVWYTSKQTNSTADVYAIVLEWPANGVLYIADPVPSDVTYVTLLGFGAIPWRARDSGSGLQIFMNVVTMDKVPYEYAWTLRLSRVQ